MTFTFQIYVEIERARLTRTLAKIKEDAGKITEAADVLQELQVMYWTKMAIAQIWEKNIINIDTVRAPETRGVGLSNSTSGPSDFTVLQPVMPVQNK